MRLAEAGIHQQNARLLLLGRRSQQRRTLPTAPSPTTTHLMVCIVEVAATLANGQGAAAREDASGEPSEDTADGKPAPGAAPPREIRRGKQVSAGSLGRTSARARRENKGGQGVIARRDNGRRWNARNAASYAHGEGAKIQHQTLTAVHARSPACLAGSLVIHQGPFT